MHGFQFWGFELLFVSAVKSGGLANVVSSMQPQPGKLVLMLFLIILPTRCECLKHPHIPPSHPENPPTDWLIVPNRRTNAEFIFQVLLNLVA